MKKLFSLILCIVLVFSLNVCAFAEGNTTTVSLTVDPSLESYTLTIPATATIDPATGEGSIDVSVSDITYVWSIGCAIKVSSENFDTTGSNLVNGTDTSKKIHYTLKDVEGDKLTSSNGHVIGLTGKPAKVEGHLALKVDGTYPAAGTYTDTLTFTVEMYQSKT